MRQSFTLVSDVTEVYDPGMFGLGDVVRRRRKARGWTQAELAEEAHVSVETIVRIEKGIEAGEVLKTDTISKIAVALGTTTPELYASTVPHPPEVRGPQKILSATPPESDVEDGIVDVSGYTPHDIPVVAEGEASPQGSLFWSDEGVLQSDVDDRISRPRDVTDPKAYGVKVRGDSMLPVFKPGMTLIISPNLPVNNGDEVYVQLLSGERLIKIARRVATGWILESTNPAYEPRVVTTSEIGAIHPVLYARRRRTPHVNGAAPQRG